MEGHSYTTVVIILQFIHVSNQFIAHLKHSIIIFYYYLLFIYLNKAGKNKTLDSDDIWARMRRNEELSNTGMFHYHYLNYADNF